MERVSYYKDYEFPISTMRELTKENKPFKLEFRKLDGSRRIVQNTLLRKQSRSNDDKNAAYKLQFIDKEAEQMGSCYIPLIIALNDKKIILDEQYTQTQR